MIKSRGCLFHLTLALVCAVITFMCYATVVMNANFAMTRTDEHAHVARIFVVPTLLALCGMVTFLRAAWRRRPRRKPHRGGEDGNREPRES